MSIFERMNIVDSWFFSTSLWYLMLLAIGIIFFPFTRAIFHNFYDYGYGFSKAIGIALISYVTFVLGTVHILPFTSMTLYLIVGMSAYLAYRVSRRHKPISSRRMTIIIIEEILCMSCFFLWSYIRAHEPSIRGLEKYMDFGFINSALRGNYFPSLDIWLAGKAINYYYFGHVTGAVLTRLSTLPAYIGYNLILAQLFALSVMGAFSLGFNIAYHAFAKNMKLALTTGFLATFLTNLGGNLHTIYAFTHGYPNENPVPFWKIGAKFSLAELLHPIELLNKLPINYWYPNATRFIPFTIHEFPLYSYVVADLHGHVFDIPFVLITLGLLFTLFIHKQNRRDKDSDIFDLRNLKAELPFTQGYLGYILLIGFFISIHLMTNAFDAPIYLALTGVVVLALRGISKEFFTYVGILVVTFFLFNQPFSHGFEPFATGLGFNCVSTGLSQTINSALKGTGLETKLIFENNCQSSTWWMLLTLWGFFLFNFLFFIGHAALYRFKLSRISSFILILFAFSTLLVLAPEFIYAKDIYPSHFRANTLFKLGYQAFIMMSIASTYTFILLKKHFKTSWLSKTYIVMFVPLFALVAIYPSFAIDSYYGSQGQKPQLNGQLWVEKTFPEYAEIIGYLNSHTTGQPTILEAQGDSYTDLNLVSSYTGLPTVGGWYVHEWLWRGSADAVGKLQPDIKEMFEGTQRPKTMALLQKYRVQYVVIGRHEREKYPLLDESKFEALGKAVFRSKTNDGVVYQIPVDTH